jgi:hypothetical protein
MGGGTERGAGLSAVDAALIAGLSFLTNPAFAGVELCRQLEAQLQAASVDGDPPLYVRYDRAVAAQREQLRRVTGQARSIGCGVSAFAAGRNRCGVLNLTIERMERNLAALEVRRGQLAESEHSSGPRARLLALLDANGCRDSAMTGERVPPPLDDGLGHSPLDQFIDDGTEETDFPDEDGADNVRRVIVPRRLEEPSTANGRPVPNAAVPALEQPQSGSVIRLGEPQATTKLPAPGERKVRIVGPVFLPDSAAGIFHKK